MLNHNAEKAIFIVLLVTLYWALGNIAAGIKENVLGINQGKTLHIFILGYVKKVSSAMAAGDHDKAQLLIRRALKRQPKRISRLFARNGIGTMR